MTLSPSGSRALIPSGRMGGAGLRVFDAIAKEWELTIQEQLVLLHLPKATFRRWRRSALAGEDVKLDDSTLERLSYILGIYKALNTLLPRSHAGWIRRANSNPLFGGKSALERMMAGQVADLFVVRQHLDAWGGGCE